MNTKLKKRIAKEGLPVVGVLLYWVVMAAAASGSGEPGIIWLALLFLLLLYGIVRFIIWAMMKG